MSMVESRPPPRQRDARRRRGLDLIRAAHRSSRDHRVALDSDDIEIAVNGIVTANYRSAHRRQIKVAERGLERRQLPMVGMTSVDSLIRRQPSSMEVDDGLTVVIGSRVMRRSERRRRHGRCSPENPQ